jgi:hypothetical protein
MKKPPAKTLEELTEEQGLKDFDWDAWWEKAPRIEIEDSFLEAIWESKGRKLPDYMRNRKK